MSKEQGYSLERTKRKLNKQKIIQARKALREQLKSNVVQEYVTHTQKTYYKLGYEKGYEDGKNTETVETTS